MFYGSLIKKLTFGRKIAGKRRGRNVKQRRITNARLGVESLEGRQMLSASPIFAALGRMVSHAVASHAPVASAMHGHNSSSSTSTDGTVTLTNRPATSYYGQSIQLTAKITGTVSGSVDFTDSVAGDLGTVAPTNGIATLAVNTLSVGQHTITATYGTSATTVTETVKAAPTHISIAASTNPAVLSGADNTASVTFTATVGAGGECGWFGSQATVSEGNVTFTITNQADHTSQTVSGAVTNGTATVTPATPLAAGTYIVTATYDDGTTGNYLPSSTGRPLTETVAAVANLGAGSVWTGSDTNKGDTATLWGGQTVSINVTQALDATNNVLTETGTIHFVDSKAGIDFTSTDAAITQVVFDPSGNLVQITGTGSNNGGTAVPFTMLVKASDGGWRPSSISISIPDVNNYRGGGGISSGSVTISPTTPGKVSVPSNGPSWHDRVLGNWNGPGPGFGFRGWHRGH